MIIGVSDKVSSIAKISNKKNILYNKSQKTNMYKVWYISTLMIKKRED